MLASLLEVPKTPLEFKSWGFSHYISHQNIIDAIFAKTQLHLTRYLIDPIPIEDPKKVEDWLERHQLMHGEMNSVLNLPSQDISTVDFRKPEQMKAWVFLQYEEHLAAQTLLRI